MFTVLLICELLLIVTSKSTHNLDEYCFCPKVQNKLTEIEEKLSIVFAKVEDWMPYIPVVNGLRQTVELQERAIRELKDEVESRKHPAPEALIMKPEDYKQEMNLLKKVEMMENLTMEVQEELESERRVRRHLEENLNETRYSVKTLGDRLQNVTLPGDASADYVELVVLSALDNMNVTSFGNHLQKLYYRVDGVAYKNETRQLDARLDLVEVELQGVSNSSAISRLEQEVETLSNKLQHLNSSFEDMWRSREARLAEMLIASRREEVQFLENKLGDLRKEIKEVQNRFALLDVAFEDEKVQGFEQSSLLKNLSVEMGTLKFEMNGFLALSSKMQKNLQILSADLATVENRFENLHETVSSGLYLQDVETKIQNLTDDWRNSLAYLVAEIEKLKHQPPHVTTSWNKEDGERDIGSVSSRLRIGGSKTMLCGLPNITDPHIQVANGLEDDGQEQLVFSCQPIGLYALTQPPVPWHCVEGAWRGSFPTCRRLLSQIEVNELANQIKNEFRCLATEVPDTTDCSYFFKCWPGKSERRKCPVGLHFDNRNRQCDYPAIAQCSPKPPSEAMKTLQNLTPTISIEPPTVDRPFSLIGTGSTGELVVYPGTTVTLQCLFPESAWGTASWYVRHIYSDSRVMISDFNEGWNRVGVSLVAAKEEDSGMYICRTPFGIEHTIVVNVTAVQCPEMSDPNVLYRGHPDGEQRILSTIAQFPCEGEFPISAVCLANGTWSRGPPSSEECPPKQKNEEDTQWGCPHIDTKERPGLVLDIDEETLTVNFKCSGSLMLVGNSFTRCMNDGQWTHNNLPKCIDL